MHRGHRFLRNAVGVDGTLWCWGDNWAGELGDGTRVGKGTPQYVAAMGSRVSRVTASRRLTCAIDVDERLWCWGGTGLEAHRPTLSTPEPYRIDSLGRVTRVAHLASGKSDVINTCVVRAAGTVWCWGDNDYGQLGDGTTVHRTDPVAVLDLGRGVVDIIMPSAGACALKGDGSVWCWGHDADAGGLGVDRLRPVQIEALGHDVARIVAPPDFGACAIKKDGTLWCWGGVDDPPGVVQVCAGGAPVVDVADLALRADGSLCDVETGAEVVEVGRDVVAVRYHRILKADGSVWDRDPSAGFQRVEGLPEIERLLPRFAAGRDGSLWCWGLEIFGTCGLGYHHVFQRSTPARLPLDCP